MCSASENSIIIEELDGEKVSFDEIELIDLLNSFGVSETIIEAFLGKCTS